MIVDVEDARPSSVDRPGTVLTGRSPATISERSTMTNIPNLFDEAGSAAIHARQTDPPSSHFTLESLGRDHSYNWRIFDAIVHLSERHELRHYSDGDSIAVLHDRPVHDDQILIYMEGRYQRRFQRNVIARQRGIIREMGWIERVDDVRYLNRLVVAHIPTLAGLDAWQRSTE